MNTTRSMKLRGRAVLAVTSEGQMITLRFGDRWSLPLSREEAWELAEILDELSTRAGEGGNDGDDLLDER